MICNDCGERMTVNEWRDHRCHEAPAVIFCGCYSCEGHHVGKERARKLERIAVELGWIMPERHDVSELARLVEHVRR